MEVYLMLGQLTLDDMPKTHKDIAEYIWIDAFKKLAELLGVRAINSLVIDGDYKH